MHRSSWTIVTIAVLAFSAAPSRGQVNHDSTLTGDGRQNYPPLGVNIPLTLTYKCTTQFCSASPTLSATNSLGGAISGTTSAAGATAVAGSSNSGTGVYGSGSTGVYGNGSYGVFGSGEYGVYGSGNYAGVYGTGFLGVQGVATANGIGVSATATTGNAVYSEATGQSGVALYANTSGTQGTGVWVDAGSANVTNNTALQATNYSSSGGFGAVISSTCRGSSPTVCNGPALEVNGDSYFYGAVNLLGYVTKPAGSFKIDHPLDPANKYLYHSFVESPDMMNIYNGNVSTDAAGNATVSLPDWFESLNRDFRYQLTVIGQFAQAMVASEISNHTFTIKTDKPNVKVSWLVTGIRQDAWANAHRIPVEVEKPEKERGSYLYPDVHGQSAEKGVLWALFPEKLRELSEHVPGSAKR